MPIKKHGYAKKGSKYPPEYNAWRAIKRRCYNPENSGFRNYGGRGIGVCDKWLTSFSTFFCDMGKRPEGCSLERKNNNGDYCPENCIWANSKTQNNNRRSNHLVTISNETYPLGVWADKLGISRHALSYRLSKLRFAR